MLRADAAAHKRVLSSIVLPRDIFRATMLLLASLLLLTPLLFGQALTGGALGVVQAFLALAFLP